MEQPPWCYPNPEAISDVTIGQRSDEVHQGLSVNIDHLIGQLNDRLFDPPCPSEVSFKRRWESLPGALDPFESAFLGGLHADRLAWVFVAAYQSAMRSCFPHVSHTGFLSFAVSEDTSGAYPGTEIDQNGRLTGNKSWIASSRIVDRLVVTIGPSLDGGCIAIDAAAEGISISHRVSAAFLGEMSQGRARFDGVAVSSEHYIDGGSARHSARHFGAAEPFFVMAAGSAHIIREARRLDQPRWVDRAKEVAMALQTLHGSGYFNDARELLRIHEALSPLGKDCSDIAIAQQDARAADWQANGRILGIYGRALRERAARHP